MTDRASVVVEGLLVRKKESVQSDELNEIWEFKVNEILKGDLRKSVILVGVRHKTRWNLGTVHPYYIRPLLISREIYRASKGVCTKYLSR
ncbi:hypothetical protein IC620_06690 [Hazenella sp. IB182357]|uniref:Uncharacterized protein n=1 Tax=Polycladospora coralii TaxID=2771432 RepID=A0A926RSX2_9BACL|nr:hypothetical protein [Polycladospora coralii]MBD1372045.1 hypothetical protein [Polycladospora coralii]